MGAVWFPPPAGQASLDAAAEIRSGEGLSRRCRHQREQHVGEHGVGRTTWRTGPA